MTINKKQIAMIIIAVLVLILIIASYNTKSTIFGVRPNAHTNTVITKSDDLRIEILKEGIGDQKVKAGDTLLVNYIGSLEDGTTFDSSYERDTPYSFRIGFGNVIKGWDEGLIGMRVGEKRKLTIGSNLAYGDSGRSSIPGGATLIFEVDLLSIQEN